MAFIEIADVAGTLPPEWQQWTQIKRLDLSSNALNGA